MVICLPKPVPQEGMYLKCLFIIVHGLVVFSLEFVEDSETVIVVTDIKGPAQCLVDLQRLFKKAVSLFRPSLNSHYRTDIIVCPALLCLITAFLKYQERIFKTLYSLSILSLLGMNSPDPP